MNHSKIRALFAIVIFLPFFHTFLCLTHEPLNVLKFLFTLYKIGS